MPNIYLELELFLDPPTTDPDALTAEVNRKISNWNKMLVADPKNKERVRRAKEHLASGLSNLQGLADKARNEKLQVLRNDIKKAGRVGGINDVKLKKLKSTHRTFFSERTIEQECGGADVATGGVPQLPKFIPPKCPFSLESAKKIAFKEMETLVEDLGVIDGSPKNLYELLKALPSDTVEKLSGLAKDLSTRAIKMPKNNLQADPLNRLAGKCIHFFKDDQNKKNYDIALKRFPFDNLCEEEFHWNIDKESGVPWDIYQESIRKTTQLGFPIGEADWLVYEYYCVVNKCPDPIPELEKSAPLANQPGTDWSGVVTKNVGQIYGQLSEQVKKWYRKAQQTKFPTPSSPSQEKQHDLPKSEDLQKTIDGHRKKFSQQKKPTTLYLNGLFEELDSMVVQYQTAPAKTLQDLMSFRVEVAEVLGDLLYAEENFVPALRYYRAILDSMPQHAKAVTRFRAINSFKGDLYKQVQVALAAKNYLACKKSIEELKTKFVSDSETEDFTRTIEKQISEALFSRDYVQQLINEKRWYTLVSVLEGTNQPSYITVLNEAKKRVANAENAFPKIRQKLQRGRIEAIQQDIVNVRNFIADHPEYDVLLQEVKQLQQHVQNLNAEFKELITTRQLIKAENKLRQFLATYPKYRHGLAGYAQYFGNGVAYFQNGLRFSLIAFLGGILFVVISLTLSYSVLGNDSNELSTIAFTIGFGFLVIAVAFSFLMRLLCTFTKMPFAPGGFGWFGTFMLCTMVALTGSLAFSPSVIEWITLHGISADGAEAAWEEKVWSHILFGLFCWFFFLLLHTYTLSFFYRCMEDEKSQPLSLLFVSIVIPIGLTSAQWFAVSSGLLLWGTVFTFWGLTALVAYLSLRKEMSTFSIACMKDYWERNTLLHQYRDTDFGQPLLLTDWYQKALNLAQQQEAQKQYQKKTQQLIEQQAQQLAEKKTQQLIQQQAQQLAEKKVQQFVQQIAQQQVQTPPQQSIPVPRTKK